MSYEEIKAFKEKLEKNINKIKTMKQAIDLLEEIKDLAVEREMWLGEKECLIERLNNQLKLINEEATNKDRNEIRIKELLAMEMLKNKALLETLQKYQTQMEENIEGEDNDK